MPDPIDDILSRIEAHTESARRNMRAKMYDFANMDISAANEAVIILLLLHETGQVEFDEQADGRLGQIQREIIEVIGILTRIGENGKSGLSGPRPNPENLQYLWSKITWA